MFSFIASPAVCSSLATFSGASRISPHTEHFLPSVRPVAVHVGATAGMISSLCASLSTVIVLRLSSSPHTVHLTTSS